MTQSKSLGNVFKLRKIIDATEPVYGLSTTGSAAANTSALTAWAAAINANAGGIGLIPPGSYDIAPSLGTTVCAFASLKGFTLLAPGVVLNDTRAYAGTDQATLFNFTACKNIQVPRGLRVQTLQLNIAYPSNTIGLTISKFLQGCEGIDMDLELDGGLAGVWVDRASGDPDSYISKQIRCRIKANRILYPYLAAFSGHGADVELNALDCGRNFFIYGTKQNNIRVVSKNQKATSLIKAYSGLGCENIRVDIYDRDSDSCNPSAPVIALEWGDSTIAAHRNIDLNLNVKCPVALPWGNTIEFAKYSDGAGAADAVGRGHILDGFKLSGVMDRTGIVGNHVAMIFGAFAAADVIRNFGCENLTFLGAGSAAQFTLDVLSGEAVFKNVNSEHNIYTRNTTNGKAVFIGCKALEFVAAGSNTDRHDYISCEITNGTGHATATNKTLLNTYLATVLTTDLLGRVKATGQKLGDAVMRATKVLTGNLTGTNNIFFVGPAQLAMYFRLTYFLVSDITDFTPGTRNETSGRKSFSAVMSGAGVWTAQLAVANDITERTQNTASAVTVSFVNGSAAGGYIAVACTNYNGANASGYFELEAFNSFSPKEIIAA